MRHSRVLGRVRGVGGGDRGRNSGAVDGSLVLGGGLLSLRGVSGLNHNSAVRGDLLFSLALVADGSASRGCLQSGL